MKSLMNFKIGLHTCGWGERELPAMLAAARELGYDGVELPLPWLEHVYPLAEIERLVAEHRVAVAPAVFLRAGPLCNADALASTAQSAMRFAAWLHERGGGKIILSTAPGRDGRRSAQEKENLRRAYDTIAEKVMANGCVPLYHNHYVVSHEVSRALFEEDLAWMDWGRWRLCVDTGHLVLALQDPGKVVEACADRIVWMHCKDVKTNRFADPAARRDMKEIVPLFTALGTGVVDFPRALKALAKARFTGWLVVEQDASPNPRETSAASLAHLKSIVKGNR
ncbi:MAG: sugar phosphate isomerase/epimerase [Verrucomicrobia bacterium]|nr:sugar phosphate isomerase/epimerase [Verrucomicrobiota bacterium]